MAMTMEELIERTVVMRGEKAEEVRQAYIERFVDTKSEGFQRYIAVRVPFEDGLYYTGYLWDCLKHSELITEDQLLADLSLRKAVQVLWDLHSAERILIEDYWKFPRDAILRLDARDLASGLTYLPEDIYIFDDSLGWSLILTHEYLDGQSRYCLKAT